MFRPSGRLNRPSRRGIRNLLDAAVKHLVAYNNADIALADPVIRQRFDEVLDIIDDWVVPSFPDKSTKQADVDLVHPVLNAIAEYWLETMGWSTQGVVKELTGGRETEKGTIDFYLQLPDGRYILIEVQFGNGGRLERDFAKLQKLHRHGLLALGVLVYFDRATSKTADSGVATFETTVARMGELGDIPACVVGVSREDTPVVDLRALKGIVYPSILGGSGEGSGEVRSFVAQALIEKRPLDTLVLPKRLQAIVAKHAMEHMLKELSSFQTTVARAAACLDGKLREELLAPVIEFARSSYDPKVEKHRKRQARRQALTLAVDADDSTSTTAPVAPGPYAPAEVAGHAVSLALPLEAAANEQSARDPQQVALTAAARPGASDPRSDVHLPSPQAVRVPRAVAVCSSAPPAKPVPLQRLGLNGSAKTRYPTQHFALAGAFEKAFSRQAA